MEKVTSNSQALYDGYKAQQKTPTWKVVAAVAFLVIAAVGITLLLASPLAPVAFPLSIALKPLIYGAIGVALAALGVGVIYAAKNGCEKALLKDLCDIGAKHNLGTNEFNEKINAFVNQKNRLPTGDELEQIIQEAKQKSEAPPQVDEISHQEDVESIRETEKRTQELNHIQSIFHLLQGKGDYVRGDSESDTDVLGEPIEGYCRDVDRKKLVKNYLKKLEDYQRLGTNLLNEEYKFQQDCMKSENKKLLNIEA